MRNHSHVHNQSWMLRLHARIYEIKHLRILVEDRLFEHVAAALPPLEKTAKNATHMPADKTRGRNSRHESQRRKLISRNLDP